MLFEGIIEQYPADRKCEKNLSDQDHLTGQVIQEIFKEAGQIFTGIDLLVQIKYCTALLCTVPPIPYSQVLSTPGAAVLQVST